MWRIMFASWHGIVEDPVTGGPDPEADPEAGALGVLLPGCRAEARGGAAQARGIAHAKRGPVGDHVVWGAVCCVPARLPSACRTTMSKGTIMSLPCCWSTLRLPSPVPALLLPLSLRLAVLHGITSRVLTDTSSRGRGGGTDADAVTPLTTTP